jgi:hypothetical protein
VRVDRNRETIEDNEICCKLQAEIRGPAKNRNGSADFLESIVHVSGDLQAITRNVKVARGNGGVGILSRPASFSVQFSGTTRSLVSTKW